MSHVSLNGAPYTSVADAASWGDLLEAVDRDTASTGTIVGAVRFDGVDEAGFREPAMLIRHLETDLIVEIETESPAALLLRILDEGVAALPSLEREAHELAVLFRGMETDRASQGLVQLADSLMNLVALVAMSSDAAGAPLDTLALDGEKVGSTSLAALHTALGPLLEAHAAHDYITVADTLEYDVAPAIPRLLDIIDALRQTAGSR
jgi:hypothetical protein